MSYAYFVGRMYISIPIPAFNLIAVAMERPPGWIPTFTPTAPYIHPPRHPVAVLVGPHPVAMFLQVPATTKVLPPAASLAVVLPKLSMLLFPSFSEFKKEMVLETGFGGLLDLQCMNKVNLKLSTWLLSKLDTDESCLIFSETKQIFVHEKDVFSTEITTEQADLVRATCGITGRGQHSLKSLEHVLAKHLDDKSSRHEIDRFMGALKNPDLIKRFNWCRYVYFYVLDAAQKVREEIIRKGRLSAISGCHLFLQVNLSPLHGDGYFFLCLVKFLQPTNLCSDLSMTMSLRQILFLNNVDIRLHNKKHSVVPQIKLFDYDSLKAMTLVCASRCGNEFSSFMGVISYSTFLQSAF